MLSHKFCNKKVAFYIFNGMYCRFGNLRENFIFANCIKRHISDVKNSRLRQDLPISINDRVVLPFPEGFIFTKLRICENKVLAKIYKFTVSVHTVGDLQKGSETKLTTTWLNSDIYRIRSQLSPNLLVF